MPEAGLSTDWVLCLGNSESCNVWLRQELYYIYFISKIRIIINWCIMISCVSFTYLPTIKNILRKSTLHLFSLSHLSPYTMSHELKSHELWRCHEIQSSANINSKLFSRYNWKKPVTRDACIIFIVFNSWRLAGPLLLNSACSSTALGFYFPLAGLSCSLHLCVVVCHETSCFRVLVWANSASSVAPQQQGENGEVLHHHTSTRQAVSMCRAFFSN